MSLTKRDLELKFGKPEKLTARLMHLQEGGRKLAEVVHFSAPNDGWVPGLSGMDPNDAGGDITTSRSTGAEGGDPSGDSIVDTLRQVHLLHKTAMEAIENWFANYQKAHPNASGTTGPARTISRPKTAGPRGDLL